MKRNKIIIIAVLVLAAIAQLFISCTENERARSFGGDSILNLPKGQKLVIATWKDADLWYLTKPMKEGDTVETYSFKEQSTYGLLEGTVTIIESK